MSVGFHEFPPLLLKGAKQGGELKNDQNPRFSSSPTKKNTTNFLAAFGGQMEQNKGGENP